MKFVAQKFLFLTLATYLLGASPAVGGSATWDLMPGSGDWNTASNWTPVTVPNGPLDTATFALSNTTNVSISGGTEVNGIVFDNPASAFTINVNPNRTLLISDVGITNNSGLTQIFAISGDLFTPDGAIQFTNGATAGTNTAFTNNTGSFSSAGGGIFFYDSSTAGSARITNSGFSFLSLSDAVTEFFNNSTAANATILNTGGGVTKFFDTSTADNAAINNQLAGETRFLDSSSAGSATIANGGGIGGGFGIGVTVFLDTSSASSSIISNGGGAVSGESGGFTVFAGNSSASISTITNDGGAVSGANGGTTSFYNSSTAANATLIANGGIGVGDGGGIFFSIDSTGGTARVEVFGNGFLDISFHNSPGLTIGSIEGDGDVFLGAFNLVVGTNNLSTTFSGVIQDGGSNGGVGGSLTKIGAGTLILSGPNTYTGDTNINGGVLQVDGSMTSNTFVNPGGTLAGTGLIFGDVVNSGIVSPGTSPGTLRVISDYTQTSAGTLRIEIAGLGAGQHDLLSVGGSNGASLDGTLQLLRLNNFQPTVGDQVTIVDADGGIFGQFSSVTDNFSGLVRPVVVYETFDVVIEFVQGSFNIGGLTPNQKSVANNLDAAAGDPRAVDLVNFLDTEPLGNLPRDYDLIAPEELAAIYEIGFSQATVQSLNIQRRTDDIRAGSTGFSANGYQMRDTHGFSKNGDGKNMLDKNPAPAFVPSPENRWGVFVTGTGQFVNVGNDDFNARGYDIISGGVTLGVDYRVSSNFAIGLSGTYARSDVDLVEDGHLEADGGKGGIYATYFSGGFYLDAAATGGWNSYDTRRTALLGDARGSTDGVEFNGLVGAGYDWNFGRLRFGPTATFQYTNIDIDSFTENGSLAALRFPDQNQDSVRSTLGARLFHDCKFTGMILRPELRAAWQHEYSGRAYPIDSQFASGAGGIFTVHGPSIGRDSALVGAGAALLWNDRVSTYVYYNGQFGRDNYDSNAVSGGVRVNF